MLCKLWQQGNQNQSILKEINWIFIGRTDAKAEAPYFGYLMWRADSLEKTLMLGKIEGGRRRGQQRMKWLDSITDPVECEFEQIPDSEGQRSLVCCSSGVRHVDKESDQLSDWRTTMNYDKLYKGILMKYYFFKVTL